MSSIQINWDADYSDVDYFTLENQIFEAKVVKVYDGDTIHIVFPYFGKMYKWNCRLTGIDTPELRTKNEQEKEYGIKVRDALREKIMGKLVFIKCGEFDKYGRLLGEIFDISSDKTIISTNESFKYSINNWMIDNEFAFYYDGGTKQDWGVFLDKQKIE